MNSRVALITFLEGPSGPVDPGYGVPGPGQPPVGIWPSPGHPSHPIAPGGPPPGIWPQPPVDPGYGQGFPLPPHVSGGPVYPPNYPSTGPIYPGGYPSHRPVFPPVTPDNTLPEGGPPPTVSLPIVLPEPPEPGHPIDPDQKFELKYSLRFGWVIVAVEEPTAGPKA